MIKPEKTDIGRKVAYLKTGKSGILKGFNDKYCFVMCEDVNYIKVTYRENLQWFEEKNNITKEKK
jgi:hypothetical protein